MIKVLGKIPKGEFGLACSGGVDSMAIANFLLNVNQIFANVKRVSRLSILIYQSILNRKFSVAKLPNHNCWFLLQTYLEAQVSSFLGRRRSID